MKLHFQNPAILAEKPTDKMAAHEKKLYEIAFLKVDYRWLIVTTTFSVQDAVCDNDPPLSRPSLLTAVSCPFKRACAVKPKSGKTSLSEVSTVSHFRVAFCLFVKTSLRAKPFIRKCVPPLTGSFPCKSNSFSYERLCTSTRFEKEAQGSSEMAYIWPWVTNSLGSSGDLSSQKVVHPFYCYPRYNDQKSWFKTAKIIFDTL